MTPLDVADGLTTYFRRVLDEYDEKINICDSDGNNLSGKDVKVYTGYLPNKRTRKEMLDLCPAIVIRPEAFEDAKDASRVSIVMYVTVFDNSLEYGCLTLFHFMEFARMMLLSENPVDDRWFIDNGMKGTVPEEQPFPQWIGLLEFDVFVPQPKRYNSDILAR